MASAPSFRLADQSVDAASEHLPIVTQEHSELRSAINPLHRLTAQRFHSLKYLQLVSHRLNYNTTFCVLTFTNLYAYLRLTSNLTIG